jgi:hypothetical protein
LIKIEDLNKNSSLRINAICEICNSKNNITMGKYTINYNRNNKGYYSCFKCKGVEMKKTCLEKYGVDSFSKTNEFIKQYKETSIKNYGVDNPNKNIHIRNKIKNTNLEKYGVENYFELDEIKEKNRIWMSSKEFLEKSKKTCLEKYGEETFNKTEDFKKIIFNKKNEINEKIKNTILNNYGVEYFSSTTDWKEKISNQREEINKKIKNTCLEKYGVDNVSKVEFIQKNMYNTKVRNNNIISNEDITEWKLYLREVRKLTKRVKKTLYENWDGYDFYDKEYIKDYLSLNHIDKRYPTIDHKKSVYDGFKEKISVEEISSINNLCITKRSLNSSKSNSNFEEFKEQFI